MSQHTNNQDDRELGVLREMIDAVRADEPDEAAGRAAQRNLLARLESTRKENPIMNTIRNLASGRVRWATATGIAALAIAAVVAFNPWGGGSRNLYAAAVERLQNARSLTFSFTDDLIRKNMEEGRKRALELKGKEDSANTPNPFTGMSGKMKVMYKEPGHFRYEFPYMGMYMIADFELKKGIWIRPQMKTYDLMDGLMFNYRARNIIDDFLALPDKAEAELGTRKIDGKTARGYRTGASAEIDGMRNILLWVDVETGYPVQLEGEIPKGNPDSPGAQETSVNHVIMRDFNFDVSLDDSLFDMTPPEGYTEGDYSRAQIDPEKIKAARETQQKAHQTEPVD